MPTADQIARFRENGVLVVPGLSIAQDLEPVRAEYQALLGEIETGLSEPADGAVVEASRSLANAPLPVYGGTGPAFLSWLPARAVARQVEWAGVT